MNALFATFLLAICLQGVMSGNHGRPMNGSWITRAGLFQGDIKLTAEQERQLNSTERQGLTNTNQLWPKSNDGVVRVPYEFTSAHDNDERAIIRAAMATYASKTCFEFVERSNEADYLSFIKDGGCWSYVGRRRGRQEVSLANGCVYDYIIIHELMHAMGFYHEQSRYDRDQYVTINWNNICCNARGNFEAETSSNTQLHDQPYDYKSLMHYGEYDFSIQYNVLKVIEAKDGTSPLGNEEGLTDIDIAKNHHLYSCSSTDATTAEPTAATTSAATAATTSDATTSEEPSSTTEGSCVDQFGRMCQKWADKNFCTNKNFRVFMIENCPSACQECGTYCYDTYTFCKRLRRYCKRDQYAEWMSTYCPDTCNQC